MGYGIPQPLKMFTINIPCPVCFKAGIRGGFVESGEHVISCPVCGFRNEVSAQIVMAVEGLINFQAARAEAAAVYSWN